VEEIAAENKGCVTADKLRDRARIGRTLAIEVLHHFDRIKFTRRIGDGHYVLCTAREVLGDDAANHLYNDPADSANRNYAEEKRNRWGGGLQIRREALDASGGFDSHSFQPILQTPMAGVLEPR
jgi:hypothetical protein